MSESKQSTKELVNAALAGDGSAFDQLYHSTIEQMTGLARSMLRNEADALDILQESYLYAFKALAGLREPEYFGTWLYRIVANRCKNFLTRNRPKMFAASLTDDEFNDWDMEDDDLAFQPEESVDDAETRRLVWEMVNALPEDQRVCVLLYHFQDMKVREIAELLDVPDNTVKSRLGYGRKKLLSQAQEIERKGTVLHGVAFFPLLGMAARQMAAETAAASGEVLAQSIAAELGAAGVAGTAAASGATTSGGGPIEALQSFVGTTAGKAVVAGVVVLAAVGTFLFMRQPEPGPVVEPPPAVIQQEPEPAPEIVAEPEPDPEPEPEEESDGFYTVTCLFQNDDGSAVQGIHVMGLRVGEYTIIVDDQPISQAKSYSQNEQESGQTTVTPEEAEALGIVRDLEYSDASLIFSVQQNYSMRLKGDGTNSTSGHAYNAAEPQDHTLYIQWDGDRVKAVRE